MERGTSAISAYKYAHDNLMAGMADTSSPPAGLQHHGLASGGIGFASTCSSIDTAGSATCAITTSSSSSAACASRALQEVQEVQRELAALSTEEIIQVEKDLRGARCADLGSWKHKATAKKRRRAKSSKKKGGPPPPADGDDDAADAEAEARATDADILRLDDELLRIDPALKGAYLQATLLCPAEVRSRDRKAAFLERENLHALRAALRLVSYWQLRFQTFGPGRAFLPMTIDGAIQDEVADMIEHCVIHVLPHTDTSGRAIVFYQPAKRSFDKFPLDKEARALFYLLDSLTTDPAIRRAGFVGIADYSGGVRRSQISAKQQQHMRDLFDVLPIRVRSCHLCHPSTVMYCAFPVLKFIVGRHTRLRMRLHSGSRRFVLDQLAACSLPRTCLPEALGGILELDMAEFVANRSIVEMSLALAREAELHAAKTDSPNGNDDPRLKDGRGVEDPATPLVGEAARKVVIDKFNKQLLAIAEAIESKEEKPEGKKAPSNFE